MSSDAVARHITVSRLGLLSSGVALGVQLLAGGAQARSDPPDRSPVHLPGAGARSAYLVKDINTSGPRQPGREAALHGIAKVNDKLFFGVAGARRTELWKSDGTAGGTTLVRDLPAVWQAVPELAAVGGTLFFVAASENTGMELWKSDGTTEGTVLVKDVVPGSDGSNPTVLTSFNEMLFFVVQDHSLPALWRSDGTEGGTVPIKTLSTVPGSGVYSLKTFDGRLNLIDSGVSDSSLWTSDGTGAGTVPIKEFDGDALFLSAAEDLLFFFVSDASSGRFQLWKSDGTSAGTVVLKEFFVDPRSGRPGPATLAPYGSGVFFSADDGISGQELWKSDGTPEGTVLVKDIAPGSASSMGYEAASVAGKLYFRADDGRVGSELWRSDGTAAGTVLVKDVNAGPASSYPTTLTAVDGMLYFSAADGPGDSPYNYEPWRSDGTESGTAMIADLISGPEGSQPRRFLGWRGDVLFVAGPPSEADELWRLEGGHSAPSLITRISGGNGNASPACFAASGEKLFFHASEDRSGAQRGLWTTDGTESGTSRAGDSNSMTCPISIGPNVVFGANDEIHGPSLWRSDGTPEGTTLLRSFPAFIQNLTFFNGTVLFTTFPPGGGELWKTDGTEPGTTMLKRFPPGTGSQPDHFTPAAGSLFFSANDGVHGRELWKTDGTEAGTVLVKDVLPGSSAVGPTQFSNVNGTLFFTVEVPPTGPVALLPPVELIQLWKSDGTPEGTLLVRDFSLPPERPRLLTNVDGTLFFLLGTGLWRSDGTPTGTRRVRGFPAVPGFFPLEYLTSFRGMLFFSASDESHGRELWRSDGTAEGTTLVRDIAPGPEASRPAGLSVVHGSLLFGAKDGPHGEELWATDGTPEGTTLLRDLVRGPASSIPRDFFPCGSLLYFSVEDPESGRELWAIPASAIPRSTRRVPFR